MSAAADIKFEWTFDEEHTHAEAQVELLRLVVDLTDHALDKHLWWVIWDQRGGYRTVHHVLHVEVSYGKLEEVMERAQSCVIGFMAEGGFKRPEHRCSRGACRTVIPPGLVGIHQDTGMLYCATCTQRINNGCGRVLVVRQPPPQPGQPVAETPAEGRFVSGQYRNQYGNLVDPCPVCRRRTWDGGHALNPDECSARDGDFCREVARGNRAEAALAEARASAKQPVADHPAVTSTPSQSWGRAISVARRDRIHPDEARLIADALYAAADAAKEPA